MIIIPTNINRANEYLLRLAKLFEQKMKTEQTYNNPGKQFRKSLKFNPPPLGVTSRNNTLGKTRKRTPNTR